MNYINIIEGFWRMNAYDRFSSSEIILYLYLVHICNQNYWKMPIACKTATLQSELGLNKSTIIRARVKLRERGLIEFTEGVKIPVHQNIICLTLIGAKTQPLLQLLMQPIAQPQMRPLIKT